MPDSVSWLRIRLTVTTLVVAMVVAFLFGKIKDLDGRVGKIESATRAQ
jgi:hypothetical protein